MIECSQKVAVGRAHSKLILVGEHAVVYGKPAIALPFPKIEVNSTVEAGPDTVMIDCRYYVGPLTGARQKLRGIALCIKETLKILNVRPKGLRIHIHSTIPIGRGLGSSAAIAIAIVRSLFAYYGQILSKQQLMALVHLAETYAHGNPSGIDMEAAYSDRPIWFQKDSGALGPSRDPEIPINPEESEVSKATGGVPRVLPLQIGLPTHLVIADSGRISDTRAAVAGIKEKYQLERKTTQQALDRLGEITHLAKVALANGNATLLGNTLNWAQDELILLGVSEPSIDRLVETARNAGALGAKLTGGGRGGCIIALAQSSGQAKVISDALTREGAHQTWYFTLGETQ